MSDYEHSTTVNAPSQSLFDYLADVRNLPRYFESMISAEPAEGEAVQVSANVGGVTREGEAWFRVDRADQRLEWGSEGPNDYGGRLEVTGDGDQSSVQVFLHTERTDSAGIDRGLRETLDNIKRLVEEGPGPGSAA